MLIELIHRWFAGILDIIFPISCFGCGKKSEYLCSACRSEVRLPTGLTEVALPLSEATLPLLVSCDEIFIASSYRNPIIKKIIWHLKYRGKRNLAGILADIILQNTASTFCATVQNIDAIFVPIPISKKRLRQRGYNQVALIARDLSLKTGIACREDILYKKIHTPPQAEIQTREERFLNLKDSFGINTRDISADIFKNTTILLVDDIITTGATLNEAVKTLTGAGFKKIIAIAAAKS